MDAEKVLSQFVLAKVTCRRGSQSKKLRDATDTLRSSTGNDTLSVTTRLYPPDTFQELTDVIDEAKAFIEMRSATCGFDGERLVSPCVVLDIKAVVDAAQGRLRTLAVDFQQRWADILHQCRCMRPKDFRDEDYPASFDAEKFFWVAVSWRPHPCGGLLSDLLQSRFGTLAEAVKSSVRADMDAAVADMRDGIESRTKEVIGEFARKMLRLASDTASCNSCGALFGTQHLTCPKCKGTSLTVTKQEKRVYDSLWEHVRELATTLKVTLPDESARQRVDAIVAPLLRSDPEIVRNMNTFEKVESAKTAKVVCDDLLALVAATFN